RPPGWRQGPWRRAAPVPAAADAQDRGKVAADYALMVNLDRERHGDLKTDKEGRVSLPTLILGAAMRLLGNPPGQGTRDLNLTFPVQAGQTLDLKDVPVPMP